MTLIMRFKRFTRPQITQTIKATVFRICVDCGLSICLKWVIYQDW